MGMAVPRFHCRTGNGACCPGVHSPVVAVGRRRFGILNPIVQFVEKLLDVRDSQLRIARQPVLQKPSLLSGDLVGLVSFVMKNAFSRGRRL